MGIRLFLLLLLLHFTEPAFSQHSAYHASIGINLAPLISGTPEIQADYFFNEYIGVFAAGGYTFRGLKSIYKVDDNTDLTSFRGAYWKLGIKGRILFDREVYKSRKIPLPWVQLLYIGSYYNENGTKQVIKQGVYVDDPQHLRGVVHGFAIALGADFSISSRFGFRLGIQHGYFQRNDDLGVSLSALQPGFGIDFMGRNQLIAAVFYRL
jgi:hypothetical protein